MVERSGGKYAILGMLSWKPMSGYDIRKTVQESIRHFWSESYGQIYPALKRLEAEKLVKRAKGAQTGRAERQVYEITPDGREELEGWLAKAPVVPPARSELLLKIFFGRLVSRDACRTHLRQFQRTQQESLQTYGQTEARLRREYENSPDLPYWLMTLSYGRHQSQGLLDWCGETLAALEKQG